MLEKIPQKIFKKKRQKTIMNFGDQKITPIWDSKHQKYVYI